MTVFALIPFFFFHALAEAKFYHKWLVYLRFPKRSLQQSNRTDTIVLKYNKNDGNNNDNK